MFEFFEKLTKVAVAVGLEAGALVEEDGVILKRETLDIMFEIEDFHRQNAIDHALITGNRQAFLQLTCTK